MPVKQPKKLLIMNILDILRKYSDEDHRLSQKDIAEILKTEYDMTADRKAIRRNILNLMDCGYNIEYSESIRMVPNPKTGEPEESYLWSDFYLEREFTDGELRLLIDSLLFSKHIPYSQCKALVDKLEGLSNVYFRSRVKHIARLPEDKTDNKQLFLTIELLDEAISRGRKVSFKYLEYGTDKCHHIKTRPDGTERVYIISPYQMAAKEGKYYLICNYDKYDDISNYRLDRITELKIMDEPAKPFDTLIWTNGRTLDLATYMKEHPYMYSSDNIRAVFRVAKAMGARAITREIPDPKNFAAWEGRAKRLAGFTRKYGIKVAFHNHLQIDATTYDGPLLDWDPNFMINFDIGHYTAANEDSGLDFVKKYRDRIFSIHVKDRTSKARGQQNLAFGQGDTPLTGLFALLKKERLDVPCDIELEYKIPEGSNAVKEVGICNAYCKARCV